MNSNPTCSWNLSTKKIKIVFQEYHDNGHIKREWNDNQNAINNNSFPWMLWNSLNSLGLILVDCGFFFAHLRECNFVDIFKKKNSFLICFVDDVNSWERATSIYHEDWTTMNFKDSTIMINLSLQVQEKTRRRCLGETIWVHKI